MSDTHNGIFSKSFFDNSLADTAALRVIVQLLTLISLDALFGLFEATTPGSDLGCYQVNGTGNHH